jgi:hypothetical protein
MNVRQRTLATLFVVGFLGTTIGLVSEAEAKKATGKSCVGQCNADRQAGNESCRDRTKHIGFGSADRHACERDVRGIWEQCKSKCRGGGGSKGGPAI